MVPVLIFLACFGAGVFSAARWLPDLAPGPVGGLAFFVVVGLYSAALAVIGLEIYATVNLLNDVAGSFESSKADVLASSLRNILLDGGTLIGFAGAIYLLAPPAEDETAGPEVDALSQQA